MLDEGMLHRSVGGTEVIRQQSLHLVKLGADPPRLRLRVIPPSVGGYAGLSGPFVLATMPDGEEVVYLDTQLQGQVVNETFGLMWIRKAWDSIPGWASPPNSPPS